MAPTGTEHAPSTGPKLLLSLGPVHLVTRHDPPPSAPTGVHRTVGPGGHHTHTTDDENWDARFVRVLTGVVPLVRAVLAVGMDGWRVTVTCNAGVHARGRGDLGIPSPSPSPLRASAASTAILPLRTPILLVREPLPPFRTTANIVCSAGVVCVSAKRGARRHPDTHTTIHHGELRIDSRRRNAAVSSSNLAGSTNAETPAFAWNRCRTPNSTIRRGKIMEESSRPTVEYDSADSAVDELVIDFRRAARDMGVGAFGDLTGSTSFPAKAPASCRALEDTFTIFIAIPVARRRPWSDSHTPDTGKVDGGGSAAARAGEVRAVGTGARAPKIVSMQAASATTGGL